MSRLIYSRNQGNISSNKHTSSHGGLRRRQSGQESLDSGMDRRQCNPWYKCLEDSINHEYPTGKVHQRTLIQSIGLISIYVFDLDIMARN